MKAGISIIAVSLLLSKACIDAAGHTRLDRVEGALLAVSDHGRRCQRSLGETNKAWMATTEVDNVSRKRNALINDITSMNLLERIVMENHDACRDESESLVEMMPSIDDPLWFYYLGPPNNLGKDFSPYFEAVENDTFDFSGMLDLMAGPCQLLGGVLYALSLNHTCQDGEEYNNINIPICLGPSCTFDEDYVEGNENFNFCGEPPLTFDVQIKRMESLVSEECDSENKAIRETTGYSNPDFIWTQEDEDGPIDVSSTYCAKSKTINGTYYDICDFSSVLEEFRDPCEEQGGTLYKFSDEVYLRQDYYGGDLHYASDYKNIPVCIGASCHARNYFENLVFPYFSFYMDGDLYQTDGEDTSYYPSSNNTFYFTGSYTPKGYSPVLENENPYSNFLLESEFVDGAQVDTIKHCKWLAKKTIEQKEKICSGKNYQIYSEQGGVGPASLICVDTCAPYCPRQKSSAKFVYTSKDDGLVTKTCKWLKRQEAKVIDAVCGRTVSFAGESIYGQAAETCTKTCGSC